MNRHRLLPLLLLASNLAVASCTTEEPKRRERVPPTVSDSTLPWNRPPKWEGSARYGSMMPQSR
jgi:hypothetical protein